MGSSLSDWSKADKRGSGHRLENDDTHTKHWANLGVGKTRKLNRKQIRLPVFRWTTLSLSR